MSSLTRSLAGEQLVFDLAGQIAELRADDGYIHNGRIGRTLVKAGALRLTLMLLDDGIEADTHHAEAPMTLQVLEGGIRYTVADEESKLYHGQLLFFGPGYARDIRALGRTALLLTITGGATDEV